MKEISMSRIPVRSSNIAAIGYSADSETLEVEFLDGSVYQYFHVPKERHTGIMSAESHGKYLARYIKGVFKYEEV